MTTTYHVDITQRLVFMHASGVVTNDELHRVYARIAADPAFDRRYRQLADIGDVTRSELTSATRYQIATNETFAPGTPRAIVAPRAFQFAAAREFADFANLRGQLIEVFRDLDSAIEWLGLPAREKIDWEDDAL